jgi:hypothetical protein
MPLILTKRRGSNTTALSSIQKATRLPGSARRAATLGVAGKFENKFDAILQRQAKVLGLKVDSLMRRLGPTRMQLLVNELDWQNEWEAPLRAMLSRLVREELVRFANKELNRLGSLRASFDLDNPMSLSYARNHVPRLITHVSEGAKETVRQVLAQGFLERRTPDWMAREIKKTIGLTPKQKDAVFNFKARAFAKLIKDGKTQLQAEDRANAMSERYAKSVLAKRAVLIARTETIRVSASGTHMAWKEAQAEGTLPPGSKRKWVSGLSDRTCPICLELSGQDPVGIDEPWKSSYVGAIDLPPAHPACRCSISLVFEGR